MNRLFLSLSFLLCFCTASFPQTDTEQDTPPRKYAIGMSYGIGGLVVRDRVASTFLYKGQYSPIGGHFETKTRFKKATVSMEFMNSPKFRTKTNEGFAYKSDLDESFPSEKDGLDFSTLKSKVYTLNTSAIYLLKKTEDRKVKVYMGYDFSVTRFEKQFLQFAYINKLTDRVTSIGYVLELERNFNPRHSLTYHFSLPTFSIARRTLYNEEAEPASVSEQRITVFAKVFGFDSRFVYQWQLSNRFSLRATYAFRYLQVSFPRKEQWAYNQGTVGLFFHF